MHTPSHFPLTLAIVTAALLGGCAASAPEAERQFGSSVRAAVAAQVADPGAAANTTPVSGMDGRAARATQLHYEASFAHPPAPQGAMTSGSGK